ncbi:MFS transporter [Blastococcus sp. TML/M2B]|uniref:MFS transporter n=1 Tax=unclassified Blastococcus TaxID=2619396 RepID=UPI00190CC3ED|nr:MULTISPECIES: MFS transporter [unclassified Blastococcus]MBN1094272.1 MFS transporter [Blastococcus sp. TML/M2B]MBN1095608.1 MFS transporter [Blastococcus sp. TML/C7B]
MSHAPTTSPAAAAEPGADDAWHPQQVAALAVVAVCGVLVSLTQSILIPVLGAIQRDLQSSTTGTEWLLTSTLLVAAVAVPVFGRLGDLYGKRRMLLVATLALVVGSVICALADSIEVMIVGRLVTGLSSAAIPLGISLIGQVLPAARAGSGIALVSATLGIGGALGLPLAALVAEHSDYHVLFWICAVGGAAGFTGIWFALTEVARNGRGRMDFPGALLLAAALVSLLLPLAEATTWGWADGRTIGLLVLAAVLLAVFVVVERRVASPLVDLVVNARPSLLLTNIASLCIGFALFASFIGTATYVQAPPSTGYGFGSSVLASGLAMLPSGLAMLALSPVSAMLSARFGPKITLAIGGAVVALGFLGRIVFTGSFTEIVIWTTVAGAGTGIAYAAMPSLILRAAPSHELAAANGLNTLARSVGSSLASAIGGTLLAAQTISLGGFDLPSLSAYRTLFGICAGAALLGALVALVIPAATAEAGQEQRAVPVRA